MTVDRKAPIRVSLILLTCVFAVAVSAAELRPPSVPLVACDPYTRDEYCAYLMAYFGPTEGPEVIKLIGEDRWYIYGDPFHSPLECWETTDFAHYKRISVTTPDGAKHCSMLPITASELQALQGQYP
jgi:hypothetical protein